MIAPSPISAAKTSQNLVECPANPGRTVQPIAVDLRGVADMLGIGVTTAKAWNSDGHLPLPNISEGKIIRWARVEIEAWLIANCPSRTTWAAIREQSIRKILASKGAGL